MKRKLFALFILIGAVGAILLVYLYLFVYYTGQLELRANIPHYKVVLFSTSTAQKSTHICNDNICTIPDLPPLEYNVRLIAEGYHDISQVQKVSPGDLSLMSIMFEKKPFLKQHNFVDKTIEEKVLEKREERSSLQRLQLGETRYFLQENDQGGVNLEKKNNDDETIILRDFSLEPGEDITIHSVHGGPHIWIKKGVSIYVYDSYQGALSELDISLDVQYMKQGGSTAILVVSPKGVFRYEDQEFTYEYIFSDFVYQGEDIIGIVRTNDTQRRENFSIEDTGNLVVLYNQNSKERKILYKTSQDIEKIYTQDNQIFIEVNEEVFTLENY